MIGIYRKLLDLLDRRARRQFILLLGLIMVMGFFDMLGVATILPFLAAVTDPSMIETNRVLALLHDIVDPASTQAFLMFLGGVVFATVIVGLGVKTVTLYAISRFGQMRKFHLSTLLLGGYMRQPYVWFLARNSADISKQVLQETEQLVNSTLIPAMKVLAQAVSLLFLIALLVLVEPVVAIASAVVIGGVYTAVFVSVRRTLLYYGQRRYQANTERFRITSEMVGGIKEVKLAGLEERYMVRFRGPARRMAQSQILAQVVAELPRYLLEAVAFGGMVILVLVMLAREGGAIGEVLPVLGLFAVASLRMFPAIQQIYSSISNMRTMSPVLDAIRAEVLAFRDDDEPLRDHSQVPPLPLRDRLELRGIRYAYPGTATPVLQDLSLTIPARTTVGVVGGTGAGKTTAIDVVLGLLRPDAGEMVVDGVAVEGANLRAWQNNLGYVPQQIFLVDASIAANIAFGVPEAERDDAAVERAARLAELHDFVVSELPEGYATMVGERGVRLSGGQRQRIGIARALYRDPDVLILDEATSALDNLTERAVMDAVKNLGHHKTIVMIAHRLSTVRGCDTIFLMERGRVAASGSYDALAESNATFREMARLAS